VPDTLRRVTQDVIACRACPRLVAHRERVAAAKRRAYRDCDYWGRPVPAFGALSARLVVVGLAPGAHGSNRTGRMFTGDASGVTLFEALHRFGFASGPRAVARDDGIRLADCLITAAVRCAPPGNRPTPDEFAACRPYLCRELALLRRARIYVALGRGAFDALLRAFASLEGRPVRPRPQFAHGALHRDLFRGGDLLCSYHPSRQNTQTGRLTRAMLHDVFRRARAMLV
jgi:uracil-DNA glycosylase family 4